MTTDAIIDAWFLETFHGQPLGVELFNRFNVAREQLKDLLRPALPKPEIVHEAPQADLHRLTEE